MSTTYRFRFPGSAEILTASAATPEAAAAHLLALASGRHSVVRRSGRLFVARARNMHPRMIELVE